MSARCTSCGAAIEWAATTKGKRMPVNPEPDPRRGNIRLRNQDNGALYADILLPHKARAARETGETLHTSHFATCEHADQHRRR